jgi:hypothetical protein
VVPLVILPNGAAQSNATGTSVPFLFPSLFLKVLGFSVKFPEPSLFQISKFLNFIENCRKIIKIPN